jgi:hypothetical protein
VNIEWIIPCRYVEVHDNLGTIIGAGIDSVWVPELPSPIQVILAVRLLAMAEELDPDQQHTVTNRVRDPSAEIVNEISGEFSVGGDLARPEWLAGIIVPMVVEFEASEEGTYTIELIVDDAPPGTQPIHIARGLPA